MIKKLHSVDQNIFWDNICAPMINAIGAKYFQRINDVVALLFQLFNSKSLVGKLFFFVLN